MVLGILFVGCSSNPVDSTKDYVENAGCDLGMKMIFVEGGTFQMGMTPEQEEFFSSHKAHIRQQEKKTKPVHPVTLDSYYLAESVVTQAQWEKVMGVTQEQQRDKNYPNGKLGAVGADYPVVYVNWEDAVAFCKRLSDMTGETYVLPTEAQWEYAARGGVKSRGMLYSGSNILDEVAWYGSNSDDALHPVKQKLPNELGLYDMSGNVWEWCSDIYSNSYYASSPQNNPTGPTTGNKRVVRGGPYFLFGTDLCVSNRFDWPPTSRYCWSVGFRVARLIGEPKN
jgi:formylglycine-generating enzyme required for sulfatase activity